MSKNTKDLKMERPSYLETSSASLALFEPSGDSYSEEIDSSAALLETFPTPAPFSSLAAVDQLGW